MPSDWNVCSNPEPPKVLLMADRSLAPSKDQPLIENIRLLGRLLGDVIREHEGESTYELIERIRQLSVAYRRQADESADKALKKLLKSLTDDVFLLNGVDRPSVKSLFTPNTRFIEVIEEGFSGGNVVPATFQGTEEDLRTVRANVQKSAEIGRTVATDLTGALVTAGLLEVGTAVRVIRDPHFGVLGTVAALPEQPVTLASGSRARVLEVRTSAGQRITVPRANVELIDG